MLIPADPLDASCGSAYLTTSCLGAYSALFKASASTATPSSTPLLVPGRPAVGSSVAGLAGSRG